MVRWLRSEEYGCKVIWATSLASYLQLPVGHLCCLQHKCLQSLFATRVTKPAPLQCYSEAILNTPSKLVVHFSLHQHCAMHLGERLGYLCGYLRLQCSSLTKMCSQIEESGHLYRYIQMLLECKFHCLNHTFHITLGKTVHQTLVSFDSYLN